MAANNFVPTGAGVSHASLEENMRAFDALPKWHRDLINYTPSRLSAAAIMYRVMTGWSRSRISREVAKAEQMAQEDALRKALGS